jgi:hypothetical protein
MALDRPRRAQHHPTTDLVPLQTTKKGTHVVSGLAAFELFVEHFDSGECGFLGGAVPDELDVGAFCDGSALDAAGGDGSTAGNREDV